MTFWVLCIIQDNENSKPWLCIVTDGFSSLDAAKACIEKKRQNCRILSAWVETYEPEKTTVFHECYINTIGNITKKDEKR